MPKRPQNVSRPWKIGYKNEDGVTVDLPGTFVTKEAANRRVLHHWQSIVEPDSNRSLFKTVHLDTDVPGYEVWESNDRFEKYTVFHRDSVYYS